MTKRKTSKTKPYLQSGVDLWGRKHLIWPHDEKPCGPGQQKRSHVVSEKLMKLPMEKTINRLINSGYSIAECKEEIKMSFGEPRYSSLLNEKQKLKRFYANISERQFQNLFYQAKRINGEVGSNFIALLEKRLDTILFRSNLARSFFEARLMINHGHVSVDQKIAKNSGHRINSGEIIQILPSYYKMIQLNPVWQNMEEFVNTSYLELDIETFSVILIDTPTSETVEFPFEIDLEKIIRYYR